MRINKKALLLSLSVILVAVVITVGTLAYFTDSDKAVNTFTVGSVGITLDEADVKTDGTLNTNARVQENKYHLLPGHTYVKDPTVTVLEDSEQAYVRMIVKVENLDNLRAAFPDTKYYADEVFLLEKLCEGWDRNVWEMAGYDEKDNVGIYEFRYHEIVAKNEASNTVLPALFTQITVPGDITNTQLANLKNVVINVEAHAIQAAGFETNENGAWTAFDGQA